VEKLGYVLLGIMVALKTNYINISYFIGDYYA